MSPEHLINQHGFRPVKDCSLERKRLSENFDFKPYMHTERSSNLTLVLFSQGLFSSLSPSTHRLSAPAIMETKLLSVEKSTHYIFVIKFALRLAKHVAAATSERR